MGDEGSQLLPLLSGLKGPTPEPRGRPLSEEQTSHLSHWLRKAGQ